jgi:hypothetical protein
MERFNGVGSLEDRRRTFRQPRTPHDSIRKLLVILAESQQATVHETAYLTYSKALDGFQKEDLEAAIAELCLKERPEGRTAFPALGTIIAETQRQANKRFERKRSEKLSSERQHYLDHPEEYVTWPEIMEELKRIQAKRAAGECMTMMIPKPQEAQA